MNKSRLRIIIAAGILLSSAAYAFWKNGPIFSYGTSTDGSVPVVRVVDGDTAVVRLGGRNETVRFLGMNTPEVVDPRKPVQCFGKEASARMHQLIDRKNVFLEAAPNREDRDIYGRLLRYIRLQDGTDLNLKMIQDGFAYEYSVGNTPHPRQASYRAAQAQAKAAKRGLWSPKTCGGRK